MPHALTGRDLDLLQAAFHAHPDATAAWTRWRDGVDWEGPVDPVGFTLLPRICRNIEANGVDDRLFPRFKGIARKAWVTNQRFKASVGTWVSALPSVDFMALPPTSNLFSDGTTVPSHGRWCHLAIHPGQAAFAIHSLLRGGWRTKGLRLPNGLVSGYTLGAGHVALQRAADEHLTLTWRLDAWFGEHAATAWADSDSVPVGDRSIRCLNRTDAMLFMLRQPVGGDPLRWASDVLSLSSQTIDWDRIGRSLESSPPGDGCRELLPTLSRFVDGGHLTAPSWGTPVVDAHAVTMTRPTGSCWNRLRQDWAVYKAAWGKEYRLGTALTQLPGYLMGRWGVTSLGGLPRGLARWL